LPTAPEIPTAPVRDCGPTSRLFWKNDDYDRSLEFGSNDPVGPAETVLVPTIMFAEISVCRDGYTYNDKWIALIVGELGGAKETLVEFEG
jgi:hypothetical protein